ncbi:MAG TPA: glycoside hydrolase family 31 protein [Coleofasciculaceae cyanobacterium]|jgi:alpha-glucosidase
MPEFFGQLPKTEAPWTLLGAVQTVEVLPQQVRLGCENAQLWISVLAAGLIRVRLVREQPLPRRSWAVTKDDEVWTASFEVQETPDGIEIKTDRLRILIDRQPCRLRCFDRKADSDDRPFAQDVQIGWRGDTVACWKQIEPDDRFYGFGERTGLLEKRSQHFTHLATDSLDYTSLTGAMYQVIPVFLALRSAVCYGIFFNTTHVSSFDVGAAHADWLQMETQGELDYYLFCGSDPAEVLQLYTELTGRMPLPPRWALGYHQCRWSYGSEPEVRRIAQEFRDRQIPCDVIHLDIDYMHGFRVFTWNPQQFPDPARLIGDLGQQGFRVVTIVDPGVKYDPDNHYPVVDEGLEQDYFIRHGDGKVFHAYAWADRSVFPDFMRSEVRDWWGNSHRALTDVGVAGIWNDMNEPAMNDRPFGDPGVKIWFPENAPQGAGADRTTYAETRNLYGQMMARSAAEALEALRPQQRSFVLTRSGYAGIQRWSAVWTGDNHSQWDYLEMSLPMLCNLGLSGVAFVGADIGGFAGNATPELFARWMQVGMLYPLMRGHSMIDTKPHEPWAFGDRVTAICREYINLRYQLLPYLYSLFWEATTTGAPILRPLVYQFPTDPQTHYLTDQVMLGASLMAAPVMRPGVTQRAVYLPAGTWYDWWTGKSYEGSQYVLADAPLETMPLYVRAGAILPIAPTMQHMDEFALTELRLKVWSGRGEFTLYEDDGNSFEYYDGAWITTDYRVYPEGDRIVVAIGERSGDWTPHPRRVIVEVVGVGEQVFEDDGSDRTLVFDAFP